MKIVALAGGVGGAKLVEGLANIISPDELTIVVNTGDDFEHLGLYICPDVDTVCYTLAGLANPETGWGRQDDTFYAIDNIQLLGGPGWFRLGDKDLATHLERSRRLRAGQSLNEIIHSFCQIWGINYPVLPMSNQKVQTMVDTVNHGELAFQEYFVKRRCEPIVKGFRFAGIESALPAPGFLQAIRQADAVVLCPSNPWVSIDPILALPEVLTEISNKFVIAVSPIIGGKTVKGPAAKMFSELGIVPSAKAVAVHYQEFLSAFVMDKVDMDLVGELSIPTKITDTIMNSRQDRKRLAHDVLDFIEKTIRHNNN